MPPLRVPDARRIGPTGLVTRAEFDLYADVDRHEFLGLLWQRITLGAVDDEDRARRAMTYLQAHLCHPLDDLPLDDEGIAVFDPVVIIKRGSSRCGVANRVFLDLLSVGGIPGRLVHFINHLGAEVWFDDAWHFMDVNILRGGDVIRDERGVIASVAHLVEHPELLEGRRLPVEASNAPDGFSFGPEFDFSFIIRQVEHRVSGLMCPYTRVKTATRDQEEGPRFGWNYSEIGDLADGPVPPPPLTPSVGSIG